jgi:RNA polymerase sigma-70 factor, ECF subfamily
MCHDYGRVDNSQVYPDRRARVMDADNSSKLTTVFAAHHAEVLAYCVRRIGHAEGEDAAAEVFAVASRRVDDIDWTTVRPWLYGVARGVLANRHRSTHRLRRVTGRLTGLAAVPADSPDDVVIRDAESRETLSALRRLRPSDREILMLYAWEELGALDIAASLGISVDAAKKRLERAKRRLAQVLHPTSNSLGTRGAVFENGTRR